MKKILVLGTALAFLAACGGKSKKDTPASLAQQVCELSAKVEKDNKIEDQQAFIKLTMDIETKYKDDKEFMKELENEVAKCIGEETGGDVKEDTGVQDETAVSIAQQWCDLNAKVAQATDDDAKNAAKQVRSAFEEKMQEKYKDNQAFLDEIGKEVEKCEDASEGK